jgi:peptide/nickel transport system substrate-binding protein
MRTKGLALAVAALTAVSLAACGAGKKSGGGNTGAPTNGTTTSGGTSGGAAPSGSSAPSGGSITMGTTDQVVAVDPAGSYDFGSNMIENQIYQYLMAVPAGAKAPEPDAAQKCDFTSPTVYTCTMKPGLKFSNGDPLTAKDVAFSFTRMVKINDPNGSWSLLGNMISAKAPSDSTVVFKLKNPNDQTWPYILGTSAGPIVDSKVFPADKLLDDSKTVGSGPYMISSYDKNQQVTFKANPNYTGAFKAKTDTITLRYFTESSNLKLAIQNGDIDVAYRTLTPTDIANLKTNSDVKVLTGAGGELRYMVFNLKTMPGSNDAQKLAIRQAVAYSVNRDQLASDVYKGTYQPAYSMVPQGIAGATEPFKTAYGTTPNKAKAQQVLQQAGVQTPVTLNIQYNSDHYGSTSQQEYGAVKQQLEATGLFKVNLQSTLWTTYSKERVQDKYPIYQLGWFPDYVDADDYLGPFLSETNFVLAHYCDKGATNRPCDKDGVLPLLTQEETKTGDARTQAFAQIQQKLATGEMPYLPLLSGQQVAVTRTDISGVQETLDPTYQFRMYLLSKS